MEYGLTTKAAQAIAATAVVETLRALGIHSGEISRSEGCRVYGRWFRKAVEEGRLRPARAGEHPSSTNWYKVSDILSLMAKDEQEAELIINRPSKQRG